jgi:hypothetical protein
VCELSGGSTARTLSTARCVQFSEIRNHSGIGLVSSIAQKSCPCVVTDVHKSWVLDQHTLGGLVERVSMPLGGQGRELGDSEGSGTASIDDNFFIFRTIKSPRSIRRKARVS